MSSSKYGVELAYALLTVIFFNHNERMAARDEQRDDEHPIDFYCTNQLVHSLPCTDEQFGLKFALDVMILRS